MASSSSSRARSSGLRSISPSGRFSSSSFQRSSSPTRVNLARSVWFSLDRSISDRSVKKKPISAPSKPKRTCMCSPTTHPGSFRCSLHKGFSVGHQSSISSPSNRLNARRSAMTNSLVRIGTVEGDLVKRALTALIRPSSHQQKRRAAFQTRPSRLSIMTKAEDL
ncbi:Serine-rich protein-related [Cinnamomum micranthum f. kanehirae]|uniref:Serine-rich protein-related n=1 Tax=Cinnamomum micranthum f. kanehirae TaxID=337451 RepID=A0A3S4ND23_9MAGN|nr:Serine-rich protein-related [Cinnamomum micranthum f. kanehirae]RWR75538.1 Serine-rich protein-related [Cinnamomum micranthum f. kanehirae]